MRKENAISGFEKTGISTKTYALKVKAPNMYYRKKEAVVSLTHVYSRKYGSQKQLLLLR